MKLQVTESVQNLCLVQLFCPGPGPGPGPAVQNLCLVLALCLVQLFCPGPGPGPGPAIQNLCLVPALCLVQLFCKFLKSFKVCRRFEKIAEQSSRIPPLAKKSVASSCQSSDGWMFEKTVKWSVGEGRRNSVTTRKASFKTLYINQVRALPEQTRFLLNRLKIKKLHLMFWHP